MKNNKLIFYSFVHSASLLLYIFGVSWILNNGEKIFGKMQNFWGPAAFLLLFVFSALVTGLLLLGKPALLFLNGLKSEALKMIFYTVGWLFVFIVLVFVFNFIF